MASSPSAAVHCARTLPSPSSQPRRAPAPASFVPPRRRQRRGAAVVAAALGDMRPAIDENPEGVLSGEWPDNFSLVSYEDLRKYLESQIVSTDKMSPTAKLSEVMSRPVEVAMADQSLAEIDALFATQSGLPVLDGEGRCIGVVSKKDKAKASNGLDSTVAEVMSSPAITLTLDKTVLEAAALMLKHKVHRIPVVNEQLQVIGVEGNPFLSEELEGTFQGPSVEGCGLVCGSLGEQDQSTTEAGANLKCSSFDWIASWAPAAKMAHGGRASLEYLKEHPEEEASVHVVL